MGKVQLQRWSGQNFNIYIYEIENWADNDRNTEEWKYNSVMESLKRIDIVKYYVTSQVCKKTTDVKIVKSILDVMEVKYSRTKGENFWT